MHMLMLMFEPYMLMFGSHHAILSVCLHMQIVKRG
jgi:hypothetical protein